MGLKLKGLNKTYGNLEVVKGIDIEIKKGELVCLLGPSGCGKTTILNMISGLEKVSQGQVIIEGKDVTNAHPKDRNIGVVFQNYALYPHMSVLDNIMFPLLNAGMKKEEAQKEAKKIAKMVEIEKHLDKKPEQLSGGQQQRVAIARGLVKKPEVLLLDEPLSNLDARLRLITRENIRKIVKESGITAVFVTHDQEEALSISDKIIVMNDRVIQQQGTPMELYTNPSNLFVAEFMGSPTINTFKGSVENGTFNIGSKKIKLPVKSNNVTIAIRPEDVKVTKKSTGIKFNVELVEMMGKDTILTGKLENKENCKIIVATEDGNLEGSELKVEFVKENIMVFDENGERIQ